MQSLGRVYVAYFNKKYHRTGTRWEGRYKAAVIQDETYLLLCMRYVELNPVRAGMVPDPAAYRWSSYGANALGRPDHLVTQHPLYVALGNDADERRASYRELIGFPVPVTTLDELRDATQHNWAAGDDSFRRWVSESGRRADRLPVGRRFATGQVLKAEVGRLGRPRD
jgi:putative transposase